MPRFLLFCMTFAIIPMASAVTGHDITGRYVLVGLISGGTDQGRNIVVLKDLHTKRSVTLSEGQALPLNPNWLLNGIFRNAVTLRNASREVEITYAGTGPGMAGEDSNSTDGALATSFAERHNEEGRYVPTDYDNRNDTQYLDSLIEQVVPPERAPSEYRSDVLIDNDRAVQRAAQDSRLRRSPGQRSTRTPAVSTEDDVAGGPVFSDLPDGPTYFE